jgi:hypothetical protein
VGVGGRGRVAALVEYPLRVRVANAVWAYGQYAVKLVWPGNLRLNPGDAQAAQNLEQAQAARGG